MRVVLQGMKLCVYTVEQMLFPLCKEIKTRYYLRLVVLSSSVT